MCYNDSIESTNNWVIKPTEGQVKCLNCGEWIDEGLKIALNTDTEEVYCETCYMLLLLPNGFFNEF